MKLTRPDGTVIEGTPDEVRRFMDDEQPLHVGPLRPADIQPLPPNVTQPLKPDRWWYVPTTLTGGAIGGGCCCPKPDPANPGAPMGWGGFCPVHDVRCVNICACDNPYCTAMPHVVGATQSA